MPVAGGLMNFFDAVHGRIELVDPATGDSGIIRLLGSPMMDRMPADQAPRICVAHLSRC